MSRSAIAIVIVAYLAVALAFAAFLESTNPGPSIFITARISGAIGNGLAPFALAAILPLLIWAVFRFKAARARGPIFAWGILEIFVLYLTYRGEMASRKDRIEAAMPTTSLSDQGREDFINNAANACVRRQTDSAINKEVGITAHQISAFCRCYAESLLGLSTIEELQYFAQNGSAPSGFEPKVQQAAAKCYPVIRRQVQ
jgi:hypothetical protein